MGIHEVAKINFALVVCRGKELERLRKVVASHGWQSDDFDIFAHKNDWDVSVQRLYPDDKVKVRLLSPCSRHQRLKATSLVKLTGNE